MKLFRWQKFRHQIHALLPQSSRFWRNRGGVLRTFFYDPSGFPIWFASRSADHPLRRLVRSVFACHHCSLQMDIVRADGRAVLTR